MNASTDAALQAADRFFRAIEALDAREIAGCFAEDGEIEDPVGSAVVRGREEIARSFADGLVRMVRSAEVRTVFVAAAGNSAAAHWELIAATPDGREVRASGIDVVHVSAEGKIARVEGYWDAAAFVRHCAS